MCHKSFTTFENHVRLCVKCLKHNGSYDTVTPYTSVYLPIGKSCSIKRGPSFTDRHSYWRIPKKSISIHPFPCAWCHRHRWQSCSPSFLKQTQIIHIIWNIHFYIATLVYLIRNILEGIWICFSKFELVYL